MNLLSDYCPLLNSTWLWTCACFQPLSEPIQQDSKSDSASLVFELCLPLAPVFLQWTSDDFVIWILWIVDLDLSHCDYLRLEEDRFFDVDFWI